MFLKWPLPLSLVVVVGLPTSTCCGQCEDYTPSYINATLSGFTYQNGIPPHDDGWPGCQGWRVDGGSLDGTYQCDYQGTNTCRWRFDSSSFPLSLSVYCRVDFFTDPTWVSVAVGGWYIEIKKVLVSGVYKWQGSIFITSFSGCTCGSTVVLSTFCWTTALGTGTTGSRDCHVSLPTMTNPVSSGNYLLYAWGGSMAMTAGPTYGC